METHRILPLKVVLILTLCTFSAVWSAFSVDPFVLRLDLSRGQTTGWIELAPAVQHRPVPVEILVFQRQVNEDGEEIMDSPKSDDLIVYPSEVLLFPGQKVRVQVSWNKPTPPRTDLAYALVLSEVPLPVQTPEGDQPQANLQTLARFRAVVALETGKTGRLSVVSAKKVEEGKVEIIVENRGEGRVPIDGMHLIIRGKKYHKFTGATGNSIQPGQKRRFLIELPYIPTPAEISYGQGN